MRGSACPCWRRWPAPGRSWLPPAVRSASSPRGSRSRSTRSTPARSRTGSSRPCPQDRRPSVPAGPPISAGSGWFSRTSTSTGSSPNEAARRDRRRRSRPAPDRRRDVHREPAERAGASRRPGAPRRGDAPTRSRPGRDRGGRPAGAQPGRTHGHQPADRPAPPAPGARPLQLRHPAGVSRRVGRHRPRSLVRTRPGAHWPARSFLLPDDGAPLGATSRPRVDGLGANEGRPRRALRRRRGKDRRHAECGRPGLPSEQRCARTRHVPPFRRRHPAAEGSARRGRGAGAARRRAEPRSGRRREARRRRGAKRRHAPRARGSRRVRRSRRSRRACHAVPRRGLPRLPLALRGLRATRARGDGVWHSRRGRFGRRRARGRRGRRVPRRSGRRGCDRSRDRARPRGSGTPRRGRPRARTQLQLDRERPPHARGLPGAPVSVAGIVVTHGPDPDLERCLAALGPQVDDLVVVANPPAPAVDARLIDNARPQGFAANANQGIAVTSAPLVVVANPDTEPGPDVVALLREFAEAHPRAGVVGPRLQFPDGSWQPSRRRFPTVRGTIVRRTPLRRVMPPEQRQVDHYYLDTRPTEPVQADWMLGAFLLLRREMLDELGGFDPGFRLYGEDIDLCYRAAKAGWERWYVPGAVVTHAHAAATDRKFLTRLTLWHWRGILRFVRKHPERLRAL